MDIAIVLGLLVAAIVLFAMEKISVDIITLLLLIALVSTGILRADEAFAGFSNDIIVILASIFVISGALQRTGVMDAIGMRLHKIASGSSNRLLLAIMSVVSFVSAFMNNTTVTAIFVPPVMGVAKQSRISASKLLMPVAFASILGGTCTLIGTSTNVAVSGYIAKESQKLEQRAKELRENLDKGNYTEEEQAGIRQQIEASTSEASRLKPLGLFEFTPLGLIIVVVGIAYMMVVGKRMLPAHKDESLTEEYDIREYLTEIVVLPASYLVGQRIFESDLSKMEFRILEVIRGEQKILPTPRTVIQANDVLLVEGKISELIKVKETAGIEILADVKLGDKDLQSEEIKIVEALITPQSDLIDRTLKEANFRARYGMTALAIYRHGQSLREKIGRIRLRLGDLLLVQGPADRVDDLRRHPDLWIMEELSPVLYRKGKGIYTMAFFAAAIIVGGTELAPLSIAFLAAAVLVILFRSITIEEAYEFIDWRLIILIGGMTAFGTAMDDRHTGTADFLAKAIVDGLNPVVAGLPHTYGVMAILGGFLLLTVVLTQPMSNAAAALVVLPVALEAAERLGANERTFAIAIMLAASVSLITPFEPSCILVYGPGKYHFRDFVKVGLALTIILVLIILLMLPVFWPLEAAASL
ncbi:MAG TPA: SLC13 family permease [Blastocatellia bacterium]|nr:SLC13 family permease [Blastocatellia bacterium]